MSIGTITISTDGEGRIFKANSAIATMLGYEDPGHLLTMTLTDIFVDPLPVDVLRETKTANKFLAKCRQKGDGTVMLSCTAVFVSDNGGPGIINVVAEGITDHGLEDKLIEYQQLFSVVADAAVDAIILIGSDGRIEYWNPTAEKLFGYQTFEVMGKSVLMLIPERSHQKHKDHLSAFSVNGESPVIGKVIEGAVVHKNGGEVPVEVSISAMYRKGRWHAAAIVRDISTKRTMENYVFQAKNLEAMSFLAGGLVHDLNNERQMILLFLELVARMSELPSVVTEQADKILGQMDNINGMIMSLLNLGKKVERLNMVEINIIDVVRGVVSVFVGDLGKNNIKVETACGDVAHIMADKTHMHQIILNLILNAKDALPDGGTIAIATRMVSRRHNKEDYLPDMPDKPFVHLSITDDGCGIPEQNLSNIFVPFFTTKNNGDKVGSGLGLSMVNRMVKSNNGYLSVRSAVGQGTTFNIYLPAMVLASKAEYQYNSNQSNSSGYGDACEKNLTLDR